MSLYDLAILAAQADADYYQGLYYEEARERSLLVKRLKSEKKISAALQQSLDEATARIEELTNPAIKVGETVRAPRLFGVQASLVFTVSSIFGDRATITSPRTGSKFTEPLKDLVKA